MLRSLSAVLFLAIPATAFPAAALVQLGDLALVSTLEDIQLLRHSQSKQASPFDAERQYISTSGIHEFIPPDFEAGDQRGPCPGLNALANHGYLPRNGVAGTNEYIQACGDVFGMAVDLGTFLAVYGTVFDGNPVSLSPGYSMGGPPPEDLSDNILGGLGILGKAQGLTGSHNKYESDASTTRGDLYVYGNNYDSQPKYFQQLHDALIENVSRTEQYTNLADFHYGRWEDSVHTNPHFFYAHFAGLLVTPAGNSFPCQLMSNHSEEFPDGSLTRGILKTFFGISGPSGQFNYSSGHERIPDNWYRRPSNDFSIPAYLLDVLEHGLKHPRLLSIGGNTNGPDTFQGVSISDLTGGAFSNAQLAEGNNLLCFVLQIIQAELPDFTGSEFLDPVEAGAPLLDQVEGLLSEYGCPQISSVDFSLYDQYPGYKSQGKGA